MFDIVDDDDAVIGQETRSVVHQTGLQHRGIHICLFTPAGKLLVQRRSKDRHASPSTLDCSVSEHVSASEDYGAAAQRGLSEELGLENIDLEPIIYFKMNYGPNDNEICRLYQGPLVEPARVHFNPAEVESVDYASIEELEKLLEQGQKPFSRWFEQMILWNAGKPTELQILATYGRLRPEAYSK